MRWTTKGRTRPGRALVAATIASAAAAVAVAVPAMGDGQAAADEAFVEASAKPLPALGSIGEAGEGCGVAVAIEAAPLEGSESQEALEADVVKSIEVEPAEIGTEGEEPERCGSAPLIGCGSAANEAKIVGGELRLEPEEGERP